MSQGIADSLKGVRNEIAEAAQAAGRNPEDVKLVAVSKTYPAEAVKEAYDAGQRLFGENRVQELETKVPILPADIEWHLIGHLQSNKAAKAITSSTWIHSVDTVKLIDRLDRIAGELNQCPKILLEINVSGEESKFGTGDDKETMLLGEAAAQAANLDFQGLMTMAPFGAEEDELRSVFCGLRQLRDRMSEEFGCDLPELSMGMSSDFPAAIAEGATLVRIGTAIFGRRTYR